VATLGWERHRGRPYDDDVCDGPRHSVPKKPFVIAPLVRLPLGFDVTPNAMLRISDAGRFALSRWAYERERESGTRKRTYESADFKKASADGPTSLKNSDFDRRDDE
jgi:hypothetical protein